MNSSGVSRILPVFALDFVPACAWSLVLVFAQEKPVPIHRDPCAFPLYFTGNVLIFAQEKRIL
jgi:hypothetical protein